MSPDRLEPELVHRFKNQISLALGFCNLLLEEIENESHRSDLRQIQQAIEAAMALLPELTKPTT